MENITLTAPLKKVGNSLCLFIPASVKEKLHLKEKEQITFEMHKTKDHSKLLSLFGATKGKLGPFTEEDRLDVRD